MPVVFRAYTNEQPVLVGGLPITNFLPYQGSILQADVSTQGLSGIYFRQLFFDGQRQRLARYPNYVAADPYGSGWSYVDGTPVDMYSSRTGDSQTSFTYKPGDVPHAWARPTEAEVFIFPRYNWWNNIVAVYSIGASNRVINLSGQTSYAIRPGDRYFVQNVFEELDAPGEWYLDKQTWKLYFIPPYGIGAAPMWAPVIRTLVAFGAGTANVYFQGFSVECAEGTALTLSGTTNCLVAANTIVNVGDYNGSGVQVAGGWNNGVVGNDISQVGRNGIELSGGVTTTLVPAGNYADNNYIHDVGVFYKEGVGINLTGVGNRASHNLIHNGPRFGIYFQGQNLLVEYNHIHDVMLETDDGGAIYTEGINWLGSRGSTVRYNYLHDISGWGFYSGQRATPFMAEGVYLDNLAGGVSVIGNIVTRMSGPGIYLNGGSDNQVLNNMVVDCLHGPGSADNNNYEISFNGFATNTGQWSGNVALYNSGFYSVYGQSAWATMPGMTVAPTNHADANGLTIWSNVFLRNIVSYTNTYPGYGYYIWSVPLDRNTWDSNVVYHAGSSVSVRTNSVFPTWAQWQQAPHDTHSVTGNPLFSNVAP